MKFLRQDAHKKSKLGNKWRKPKGWHNKVRLVKRGYRRMPRIGFGKTAVDKHKIDGKELIFVSNVKELPSAKNSLVMLAKVGMKRKIELIEEGLKLKLDFGFDAPKLLKEMSTEFSESTEMSKSLKAEKAKKVSKKSEKKEEKLEEKTEEKTEAEKKKELDKKLIHTK